MGSQHVLGFGMILAGLALTSGGILVLSRGRAAVSSTNADPSQGPPTSEEKGRKFEDWVVRKFNPSYFIIKDWRGDKNVAGIYAESSKLPDLEIEFRLKDQRTLFAVECKWRRSFESGGKPRIEWATPRQIDTYRQFQRDRGMPVFAVIGIGGEPDHPAELYIVHLDRLKYPFATAEYLAKFRRGTISDDFFFDSKKPELR